MNRLIWVIDSPYSRATKWLLLKLHVSHADHLLGWQNLAHDPLLLAHNPKQQVPTLLLEDRTISDSLLIALQFLPDEWHQTVDAQLFRLADGDFEAAIIFFFRANLLEKNFSKNDSSEFMRQAGETTYRKSLDVLFDTIQVSDIEQPINFGLVLVFSTILACRHLANSLEVNTHRLNELQALSRLIETDKEYQHLVQHYFADSENALPFYIGSEIIPDC
ncbi:glutathione S-transferase N-terminal domain-containing protein [Aestuariibacter halophilus]|uniref:Glutathione S-transferase N-terminal domain-containing protein n=1 Tax=Fluctibacter halophilus TaxID=226011 RepID=A0ABS8G8F2_9ALTE|nr:glutathione S-transferase N-terminal domain-containing protein [Aestuariibacter halophilus]MCC2616820.1 glutathione S-transferase N-terminal domain-containing protein [Aestuariibacter halophilus]